MDKKAKAKEKFDEDEEIQMELAKRITDCRDFAVKTWGAAGAKREVVLEVFDYAVDCEIGELDTTALDKILLAKGMSEELFKDGSPEATFDVYARVFVMDDGE